MDSKEFLEKTEEFAKKIIRLAAEEKLTVNELYKSADIAKAVADNSTVEREAVQKTDFPSAHIDTTCDEIGLFGD